MGLGERAVIRHARLADLERINAIVEECVSTWELSERVKRLSLASYRYREQDLDHFGPFVAELRGTLVGVAASEPADPRDTPAGRRGVLLHGIYVDPECQRMGIGSSLTDVTLQKARAAQLDGVLVKAQASAVRFFTSRGFSALPVESAQRDYRHRYWRAV